MVVVAHPSFSARLRGPSTWWNSTSGPGCSTRCCSVRRPVARRRPDQVWITWGDQVGVLPATLDRLAAAMAATPAPAAALPTVVRPEPLHSFRSRSRPAASPRCASAGKGTRCRRTARATWGVRAAARARSSAICRDYAADVEVGQRDRRAQFRAVHPVAGRTRDASATVPCDGRARGRSASTRRTSCGRSRAWMRRAADA